MDEPGRSTQPMPERSAAVRLDARAVMQGQREIVLVLDGEAYRLRITAKEKLILTK